MSNSTHIKPIKFRIKQQLKYTDNDITLIRGDCLIEMNKIKKKV